MEEISVEGEKYVKASVLAARFGYTADYLGQLCRGGQIKASLVGRSWYVNEDSLREHRQGRYRSTSAKSKESLRKMTEERGVISLAATGASMRGFKYEEDQDDLLPNLNKKELSQQPEREPIKQFQQIINISAETERQTRKLDSEPNIVSISKSKNINSDQKSIPQRPVPIFRTIPNFSATPTPIAKPVSERPIASPLVPTATFGGLKLALLTLAIITAESLVIFGSLGLEKRLVAPKDQTAMVLYGFDVAEIRHAFEDTFRNTFLHR